MKRAPRSRQRHDLYAKYHDYDSEISDLLGECGFEPSMRGKERRWMLKHITLAATEFGLLHGVRQFTVMAYLSFLPEVLSLGWDSQPLGLPKSVDDKEPVVAFTVNVTPEVLKRFRTDWNVTAPVLEFGTRRAA